VPAVVAAAAVKGLHLGVLLLLLLLLLLKTASWIQAGAAAETIGRGAAAAQERRIVTGHCAIRTALLWEVRGA
jgi:hypothetical protein